MNKAATSLSHDMLAQTVQLQSPFACTAPFPTQVSGRTQAVLHAFQVGVESYHHQPQSQVHQSDGSK